MGPTGLQILYSKSFIEVLNTLPNKHLWSKRPNSFKDFYSASFSMQTNTNFPTQQKADSSLVEIKFFTQWQNHYQQKFPDQVNSMPFSELSFKNKRP